MLITSYPTKRQRRETTIDRAIAHQGYRNMISKASASRLATHIFLLVVLLHQTNAFHQPRTTIGRPSSRLGILPLDGSDRRRGKAKSDGDGSSSGDGIYYENDLQISSSQPDTEQICPLRQSRLSREAAIQNRFASGQELADLREDRHNLQENLRWSQAAGDVHRVRDLKKEIKRKEEKDPDFVYAKAVRERTKAEAIKDPAKREFAIRFFSNEADVARSSIGRFQLEGLWVGNYENGPQLVNVTYSDVHTLVATKITGDKFIPRGDDSFTANLAPSEEADPIELSDTAASKWGAKKLQRFPGEGLIALEGGRDKKAIDGQLVMFDGYFSFSWIDMKHTVFFSRPSPSQTIHMLRDDISKEDEMDNIRSHLEQCYSLDDTCTTTNIDQAAMYDINEDPFRRILRSDDFISVAEEGKKADGTTSKLAFLKLNKLKGYLDDIFLG